MCMSNNHALRVIIWSKQFYQRYSLNHVLLLLTYTIYIFAFATAFFLTETRRSSTYHTVWQQQVSHARKNFVEKELIPDIFNNTKLLLFIHDHKSQYMNKLLRERLAGYEKRLRLKPPMPVLKCTFTNSLLYAFSCVTTIGYSYMYPLTRAGRILSIAFSIFGIPFTIIVVKDIEYLLVKLLSYPCILCGKLWHVFRFCTLGDVTEDETEQKLGIQPSMHSSYRINTAERLLLMPTTVAIMALMGWISLGCTLCHLYNPQVESHLLVYFVFNSLTTIGVGGIDIAEHPVVFGILFVYLICGLAIVSLFINLIHTKFTKHYWLPGHAYHPIPTTKNRPGALAAVDSFDDEAEASPLAFEPPIYRYTTVGIFQTEDRVPVVQAIRQSSALTDATTQTSPPQRIHFPQRSMDPEGPKSTILYVDDRKSRDDVNSLLVETYAGRPARLISASETKTHPK